MEELSTRLQLGNAFLSTHCTNDSSLTQCKLIEGNTMMEAQFKSKQYEKKDGMGVFGETVF